MTGIKIRCMSIAGMLCALMLQSLGSTAGAQQVVEKTNLLGVATLSPNIGTEISFSRRWSLEASLSYHPWKSLGKVRMRHWLVSPELRYWLCRSYEGSFFGLHALAGGFNVMAVPLTGLSDKYVYTGFLSGAGLSYGYHLPLSARWSLEFIAGAGYAWINYDRYECRECLEKIAEGKYHYFGLTRLGISLVYFLY